MLKTQPKRCAAGTCWVDTEPLEYPCVYGHYDCSWFHRGPCHDEHLGEHHDPYEEAR